VGLGPADPSVRVIHHGVDTDTFSPNDMLCDRKPHLLSVVNDWVNRDWCCGFNLWRETTKDLPGPRRRGTPGLSEPAKSVADLVMKYRSSLVFLNTSLISPVPTALLEAMACGCAVVSTRNCMIPEALRPGLGDHPPGGGRHRVHGELMIRDQMTDLTKVNAVRPQDNAADRDTLRPAPVNPNQDRVGALLAQALLAHQRGYWVNFDVAIEQGGQAMRLVHRRGADGRPETNVSFEDIKK
jgi:hypothetical protein